MFRPRSEKQASRAPPINIQPATGTLPQEEFQGPPGGFQEKYDSDPEQELTLEEEMSAAEGSGRPGRGLAPGSSIQRTPSGNRYSVQVPTDVSEGDLVAALAALQRRKTAGETKFTPTTEDEAGYFNLATNPQVAYEDYIYQRVPPPEREQGRYPVVSTPDKLRLREARPPPPLDDNPTSWPLWKTAVQLFYKATINTYPNKETVLSDFSGFIKTNTRAKVAGNNLVDQCLQGTGLVGKAYQAADNNLGLVEVLLTALEPQVRDVAYEQNQGLQIARPQGTLTFGEWIQKKEEIGNLLGLTNAQKLPLVLNTMNQALCYAIAQRLFKPRNQLTYEDLLQNGRSVESEMGILERERQYLKRRQEAFKPRTTFNRATGIGEVKALARWNDSDWKKIMEGKGCGNCGWPGHRRSDCKKDPKTVIKTLTDAQRSRLAGPGHSYNKQGPPKTFHRETYTEEMMEPETPEQ